MLSEPGAVLCRVSRSFLRFGQLELFAQRSELDELLRLADYSCFREYPHLLETAQNTPAVKSKTDAVHTNFGSSNLELPSKLAFGPVERYISLYRCIAQRTAHLVANWLRVGYVQGNMNSDNTLVGGATIDYGPYGWMERYDPMYQPFTSDRQGNFAFAQQPTAMQLNVSVLGKFSIYRKLSL